MNKKAQAATDTPIIISIFTFQSFIIVALGFLNITPDNQVIGSDLINFTQNIVNNISYLGWANTIIFTPLIIAITYIIAKLIRGGG